MDNITPARVCKVLEGITALQCDDDQFSSMVYRFCHLARGSCKGQHSTWVKEFLKVETEVANAFYLSPRERACRRDAIIAIERSCEF